MANTTPKKRPLHLQDFEALMVEVTSLYEKGYISNGNWTLAQICGHLSDWMRFPIDGYPVSPLPMRAIFWLMQKTVGSRMKQKILAEGFKGGTPTMQTTVPAPDAMTDQQGVEQLREMVNRVSVYHGKLFPSPLFGPLDHETMVKINLRHAEHHLGYLEPK